MNLSIIISKSAWVIFIVAALLLTWVIIMFRKVDAKQAKYPWNEIPKQEPPIEAYEEEAFVEQ
jgi:hypothetical protein